MSSERPLRTPKNSIRRGFALFLVCLLLILCALFHASFDPDKIHFSNDAPLGIWTAQWLALPDSFSGCWDDLNWLGLGVGISSLMPTNLLRLVLGPLYFARFFPPVALLMLGLCAWVFFRQLRLASSACFLAALAAALNSVFFSNACWGVASQTIALGMDFLALALLASNPSAASPFRRRVSYALAGLAVGLGVMEAADIGAIFSLFVAAFVLFQSLTEEGPAWLKVVRGIGRMAIVAAFAAFIATQTLVTLVGTQIKGVVGTEQDAETKAQRWDWATQWSLPKVETLSLIIPGLFGYRMDTPGGGNYWGAVGRDAAWDRYFSSGKQGEPPNPNVQFIRHAGGGSYAGVLVFVIAAWAVAQSFRKKDSAFTLANRKFIWFWAAVAGVSLLLAFGRHAPFYQFLYALPYFSTIRNPAKFIYIINWSLVILFAYGVHGLTRRYLEIPAATFAGLSGHLKNWWAKAALFDKRWTVASVSAVAISLLGWLIYASSRPGLEAYLQTVQFDAAMAKEIAGFSLRQVGWFVVFLTLAVASVTLVLSGALAGPRGKWGAVLLGALLAVDLARANQPWIIYWNYKEKYATNPVIDRLREKPYEQRVAIFPEWILRAFSMPQQAATAEQYLTQLYRIEWAQHHFPYYDIQSLDIIQMPREPQDYKTFETALLVHSADTLYLATRRWELTNTRYLLGLAVFADFLNNQFDPARGRFRVAERFDIVPKPGVDRPTKLEELTAVSSTNGVYALIEFTGALPRVQLYSSWQASTNDQTTLQELARPGFDPSQTVLVADGSPAPQSATTNQSAGTVEFASYAPKRIVLKAQAVAPAVLLLNDKYDPNWQVLVDGKRQSLLRCNFIMRGVYLTSGPHTVEFTFKPSLTASYVTVAAVIVGILLIGYVAFSRERTASAPEKPRPSTSTKPDNSVTSPRGNS